jgi:hypothetical protein
LPHLLHKKEIKDSFGAYMDSTSVVTCSPSLLGKGIDSRQTPLCVDMKNHKITGMQLVTLHSFFPFTIPID